MPPHTFLNIQALRGVAALMVVFHHSVGQVPSIGHNIVGDGIGYLGVDLFFVISGFVIYLTANKPNVTARAFILSRITRVVPLYWFFTFLLAVLIVGAPSVLRTSQLTIPTLVKSLLFIPHYNLSFPNQIWPILVPGWSLNYEIFFYAITGIGVALWPRRILVYLGLLLVSLVALGAAVQSQSPIFRTIVDPKMLEFLGGALLADLYLRCAFSGRGVLAAALPVGILLLAFRPTWLVSWSPLLASPIAACVLIVMGLIALEAYGCVVRGRIALMLGAASYSIYLSHLFTLGILRSVWMKFSLPTDNLAAYSAYFMTALALSAFVGVAIYWFIEMPLLQILRGVKPEHRARHTDG